MPIVTIQTFKNGATLVSAVIDGPSAVNGFTENYTVIGTLSSGATITLTSSSVLSIISGNSVASIDSAGVVTNSNYDGLPVSATIQAVVTRGDVTLTITRTVSVQQRPDPYFSYNVVMFPCDTLIPLASTEIIGNDTINNGDSYDYNVQGTLVDSRVGPMDSFTTWEIISGNDYASISSAYGIVTIPSNIENDHTVVIRATTTYNGGVVTSTKSITVYGIKDAMMFSGDTVATVSSLTISGPSTLTTGASSDYNVTGTLSDGRTGVSMDNAATWDIVSGSSYVSLNASSGNITVNPDVIGNQSVTVRASVTLNSVTTTATFTTTITGLFEMLFAGDLEASVAVSTSTISGSTSLSYSQTYDYSISGTLTNGNSLSLDSSSTWDITAGGSYASINSSTGVLTVNASFTGVHTVTIRATTVFNSHTTTKTLDVTVYGTDVDSGWNNTSMLFAGNTA